jgi:hypothetical protein
MDAMGTRLENQTLQLKARRLVQDHVVAAGVKFSSYARDGCTDKQRWQATAQLLCALITQSQVLDLIKAGKLQAAADTAEASTR